MRFYTIEQLSPKRALTPEGYLLCEDVPLARTGTLLYGPGETPIKPAKGSDVVRIHRRPEDVFAPITLASYQGKPFCDDHPEDDVTPKSWAQLAKGIILNPRRGAGDQADVVLGDILVTDPSTIKGIRDNEKVEVSVGYDADYEEVMPGEGFQHNIIVNHVAWVTDGRCGPRCSIGDAKAKERKKVSKFQDYLTRAFKAKTVDELGPIADEMESAGGGESAQHIHVHMGGASAGGAAPAKVGKDAFPPSAGGGGAAANPEGAEGAAAGGGGDVNGRLTALETSVAQILEIVKGGGGAGGGMDKARDGESEEEFAKRKEAEKANDDETVEGKLEMEAPPGTDDKARKAKDSSYLADAWATLVSQIEIITPGARFPTFDSAARPVVTYTKICGMRTETLERAYQQPELASVIDRLNGNRRPDFPKMTCDAARVMIASVAGEAGRRNNSGDAGGGQESFGTFAARQGTAGGFGVSGKIKTPADLNKMAKALYKV